MYYLVVDLDQPYGPANATQAGLIQPPKIGGDWLFDLLNESGSVVQSDCTAPAGSDIDTLSEIAGSPVGSTFKRDVNNHLFP